MFVSKHTPAGRWLAGEFSLPNRPHTTELSPTVISDSMARRRWAGLTRTVSQIDAWYVARQFVVIEASVAVTRSMAK